MFSAPISVADTRVHADALTELGFWAHTFTLEDLSPAARTALDDVLANLLAVALAGAGTAQHQALITAWQVEPGTATLLGGGSAPAETAAWLNGVASVALERDEGNRLTKGHPASQSFFAVLALAEKVGASGRDTLTALAVAYEIGARFGRATTFSPGVHTHGTFGVPGAAAGCARLLGLDAAGISLAIDTGCALPLSTNWGTVRAGSSVRDQWIGAGNSAGLAAARFAAAHPRESVRGTLPGFGGNLGTVDTEALLDGLGTSTLIEHGYFKRHSACAYTHGPADAALLAREELATLDAELSDITAITVETVAAGVALADTSWDSRHGAYFSVPFAVASALTHGDVSQHRADPENSRSLLELASRVTVTDLSDIELPSPTHRPARVTITVADGRQIVREVAHPLGDADLSPFDYEEKAALLDDILSDTHAATPTLSAELVLEVVAALATAPRAGVELARLRHPHL